VEFCQFVARLYPHLFTNFGRFILVFFARYFWIALVHGMLQNVQIN